MGACGYHSPRVLPREGAGQRQMHGFISAFGPGSCPLPGRESFGLGLKGARGERAGATPETASGCGVQVSGQPRAARPPPKASGGPPPGAANSPHSRGGRDDGHPATSFGVSPCPSEGARRRR